MARNIVFVVLIVLLSSGFVLHPVNITVTDISYKEKKLHMKVKIFTDDFQSALNTYYKANYDFINKGISAGEEKNIQRYVSSKILIQLDNVPVKWTYKRTSRKDDVIYIEYEAARTSLDQVKTISATNTLLFDDFPEQKNIVNFHIFDQVKVLTFDNGAEENTKQIRY